jgi:hypothetical protein
MAKTLKQMMEVYAPKSKDEKRFKDKHVVAKYKLDDPSEDDKLFTGSNVKEVDREATKHGYSTGNDEKVYEQHDYTDGKVGTVKIVHPKAIVVSHAGKGKYKVHEVGKHFADGIKVGEHLTDSELDDAAEMGAKIYNRNTQTKTKIKEEAIDEKTLTPAEMKKREEIAKAIARKNPKMAMSKKMAIATATAKRVAEEDLHESEDSHKAFQDQHNKAARSIKDITKTLSDHYNAVTDKKHWSKGEAQWHHVNAIKNINRALEDLQQNIAQEVDYSKPPKPISMKEGIQLDDEGLELLNIVYDSLTDENKAVLEDIIENNPDQLVEFLDQLEVDNG